MSIQSDPRYQIFFNAARAGVARDAFQTNLGLANQGRQTNMAVNEMAARRQFDQQQFEYQQQLQQAKLQQDAENARLQEENRIRDDQRQADAERRRWLMEQARIDQGEERLALTDRRLDDMDKRYTQDRERQAILDERKLEADKRDEVARIEKARLASEVAASQSEARKANTTLQEQRLQWDKDKEEVRRREEKLRDEAEDRAKFLEAQRDYYVKRGRVASGWDKQIIDAQAAAATKRQKVDADWRTLKAEEGAKRIYNQKQQFPLTPEEQKEHDALPDAASRLEYWRRRAMRKQMEQIDADLEKQLEALRKSKEEELKSFEEPKQPVGPISAIGGMAAGGSVAAERAEKAAAAKSAEDEALAEFNKRVAAIQEGRRQRELARQQQSEIDTVPPLDRTLADQFRRSLQLGSVADDIAFRAQKLYQQRRPQVEIDQFIHDEMVKAGIPTRVQGAPDYDMSVSPQTRYIRDRARAIADSVQTPEIPDPKGLNYEARKAAYEQEVRESVEAHVFEKQYRPLLAKMEQQIAAEMPAARRDNGVGTMAWTIVKDLLSRFTGREGKPDDLLGVSEHTLEQMRNDPRGVLKRRVFGEMLDKPIIDLIDSVTAVSKEDPRYAGELLGAIGDVAGTAMKSVAGLALDYKNNEDHRNFGRALEMAGALFFSPVALGAVGKAANALRKGAKVADVMSDLKLSLLDDVGNFGYDWAVNSHWRKAIIDRNARAIATGDAARAAKARADAFSDMISGKTNHPQYGQVFGTPNPIPAEKAIQDQVSRVTALISKLDTDLPEAVAQVEEEIFKLPDGERAGMIDLLREKQADISVSNVNVGLRALTRPIVDDGATQAVRVFMDRQAEVGADQAVAAINAELAAGRQMEAKWAARDDTKAVQSYRNYLAEAKADQAVAAINAELAAGRQANAGWESKAQAQAKQRELIDSVRDLESEAPIKVSPEDLGESIPVGSGKFVAEPMGLVNPVTELPPQPKSMGAAAASPMAKPVVETPIPVERLRDELTTLAKEGKGWAPDQYRQAYNQVRAGIENEFKSFVETTSKSERSSILARMQEYSNTVRNNMSGGKQGVEMQVSIDQMKALMEASMEKGFDLRHHVDAMTTVVAKPAVPSMQAYRKFYGSIRVATEKMVEDATKIPGTSDQSLKRIGNTIKELEGIGTRAALREVKYLKERAKAIRHIGDPINARKVIQTADGQDWVQTAVGGFVQLGKYDEVEQLLQNVKNASSVLADMSADVRVAGAGLGTGVATAGNAAARRIETQLEKALEAGEQVSDAVIGNALGVANTIRKNAENIEVGSRAAAQLNRAKQLEEKAAALVDADLARQVVAGELPAVMPTKAALEESIARTLSNARKNLKALEEGKGNFYDEARAVRGNLGSDIANTGKGAIKPGDAMYEEYKIIFDAAREVITKQMATRFFELRTNGDKKLRDILDFFGITAEPKVKYGVKRSAGVPVTPDAPALPKKGKGKKAAGISTEAPKPKVEGPSTKYTVDPEVAAPYQKSVDAVPAYPEAHAFSEEGDKLLAAYKKSITGALSEISVAAFKSIKDRKLAMDVSELVDHGGIINDRTIADFTQALEDAAKVGGRDQANAVAAIAAWAKVRGIDPKKLGITDAPKPVVAGVPVTPDAPAAPPKETAGIPAGTPKVEATKMVSASADAARVYAEAQQRLYEQVRLRVWHDSARKVAIDAIYTDNVKPGDLKKALNQALKSHPDVAADGIKKVFSDIASMKGIDPKKLGLGVLGVTALGTTGAVWNSGGMPIEYDEEGQKIIADSARIAVLVLAALGGGLFAFRHLRKTKWWFGYEKNPPGGWSQANRAPLAPVIPGMATITPQDLRPQGKLTRRLVGISQWLYSVYEKAKPALILAKVDREQMLTQFHFAMRSFTPKELMEHLTGVKVDPKLVDRFGFIDRVLKPYHKQWPGIEAKYREHLLKYPADTDVRSFIAREVKRTTIRHHLAGMKPMIDKAIADLRTGGNAEKANDLAEWYDVQMGDSVSHRLESLATRGIVYSQLAGSIGTALRAGSDVFDIARSAPRDFIPAFMDVMSHMIPFTDRKKRYLQHLSTYDMDRFKDTVGQVVQTAMDTMPSSEVAYQYQRIMDVGLKGLEYGNVVTSAVALKAGLRKAARKGLTGQQQIDYALEFMNNHAFEMSTWDKGLSFAKHPLARTLTVLQNWNIKKLHQVSRQFKTAWHGSELTSRWGTGKGLKGILTGQGKLSDNLEDIMPILLLGASLYATEQISEATGLDDSFYWDWLPFYTSNWGGSKIAATWRASGHSIRPTADAIFEGFAHGVKNPVAVILSKFLNNQFMDAMSDITRLAMPAMSTFEAIVKSRVFGGPDELTEYDRASPIVRLGIQMDEAISGLPNKSRAKVVEYLSDDSRFFRAIRLQTVATAERNRRINAMKGWDKGAEYLKQAKGVEIELTDKEFEQALNDPATMEGIMRMAMEDSLEGRMFRQLPWQGQLTLGGNVPKKKE